MFTKAIISSASAAAIMAGSSIPAFAYRVGDVPPLPTTHLRQHTELRDLHNTHPLVDLSKLMRGRSVADASGRSYLARSFAGVRSGQRNYRRHVLGWARGKDYRVLDRRVAVNRKGIGRGRLPFSLVTTGRGRGSHENYGKWMWDRPTRRDVRSNNLFNVVNRDRDLIREIQLSGV